MFIKRALGKYASSTHRRNVYTGDLFLSLNSASQIKKISQLINHIRILPWTRAGQTSVIKKLPRWIIVKKKLAKFNCCCGELSAPLMYVKFPQQLFHSGEKKKHPTWNWIAIYQKKKVPTRRKKIDEFFARHGKLKNLRYTARTLHFRERPEIFRRQFKSRVNEYYTSAFSNTKPFYDTL